MLSRYEQIRKAAREYPDIQGLRMIPVGLFFLLLAPQHISRRWLGGQGNCTYSLVLLIAITFSWFLIGQYYQRVFGQVRPLRSAWRQGFWGVGVLVFFIVVVILENGLYRANNALAISPTGLALAGLYLLAGLVVIKRWYFTLFGATLLGIALLPLLTHTTVAHPLYGTFGLVFSLVFGVGLILTGLLDHLRLRRYFQPFNGEEYVRGE